MTSVPGPNDPTTAYPHHVGLPGGGGGSVGQPAWFQLAAAPYIGTDITPTWTDYTNGVTASPDAQVDADDATKVKVLTAGTYLLACELTVMSQAGQTASVQATVYTNDNSVGPLGDLHDYCDIAGAGSVYQLKIGAPLVLAENDTITAEVFASGHSCQLIVGYLHLVRLG